MAGQLSEEELLDLARRYSFRSRMDRSAVSGPIMVWGRGSLVRDVNGVEYLDFNSGQMCAALGHNHPRIVQALQESCESIIHSHMSMFNDREIILASRMAEISPPGMKRSMFLTSGSDANEAAMAIAKRYTGGYEIASPAASFHGMNDSTRAVTYSGWHEGYGPYAPGNYATFAPYRYRCTFCRDRQGCDYSCLDSSFEAFGRADGPAAGGGYYGTVVQRRWSNRSSSGLAQGIEASVRGPRRAADSDEAQTGLAKLGSMWAFQQEDVVPDIFTVSRLGGGIAISAAVTTDEIESSVADTGLVVGHSHSNDPLPCNAAIASIDIILQEALVDVANRIGDYWRGHLEALAQRHELVGDLRGRGLLQGIELVEDRVTRKPAYRAGSQIGQLCLENGLIFSLRRGGLVLRFVPPFTTTEQQLDAAAEILDHALRRVVG